MAVNPKLKPKPELKPGPKPRPDFSGLIPLAVKAAEAVRPAPAGAAPASPPPGSVLDKFRKKYGPLPLYGWLGVGAAAGYTLFRMTRR